MPGHAHPADALVADVVGIYSDGARRLEGIVAAGLRRGLDPSRLGTLGQRVGDSTLAYRQRQLEQANAVLDELGRQGKRAAPLIIGRAYRSGVVSVDKVAGIGGEFGRIHVRAVERIAGNLTASLERATENARTNVAFVFQRADELAGGLPGNGRVAGVRFLGRRVDDPYRRLALEEIGAGTVGLATRREVSEALARRLVTEGVTDGLTGFVDRGGRRWSLETYTAMAAQTTTREAMGSIPCFSCGKFKRRPSDICKVCGDDPVSSARAQGGGSDRERAAFDKAYGYGYESANYDEAYSDARRGRT